MPEPLPLPVTDNHTHLPVRVAEIPEAEGVRLPLAEQLARAASVGVTRIITVGCELPDLVPTLELTRHYPQLRAALAIHPNEAARHCGVTEQGPDGLEISLEAHHCSLEDALGKLAELLRNPKVVAVGETGFDFFRTSPAGHAAQENSFAAHIALAKELDLPLQIHDRQAHEATVDLLKRCGAPEKTVFHCFSGDRDLAEICAENGWYCSFAGPITFRNNPQLREALRILPRELVLAETDAPYLTPMPYRGRPNASYLLPWTIRTIATEWDETEEGSCEQLQANTQQVYRRW